MSSPRQFRAPTGSTPYEAVMMRTIWDDDCLLFIGTQASTGYGYITIRRKRFLVHRIVAEHNFGPSDLFVLHSCDNPPCVNIEHLRYGTSAENTADMVARHRDRNGNTLLADDDVRAIRADTRIQRLIAADYGVGVPHISAIKSGKARKRVT